LSLFVLLPALILGTTRHWAPAVARKLACLSDRTISDAVLIENLDPAYLPFEMAAGLQKQGSSRVVVLVSDGDSGDTSLDLVSAGVAELMARVADVKNAELLPIDEVEPIAMNAAYQARKAFKGSSVRSVTVVAPAFRSQRTHLVYRKALEPIGLQVRCVPVWGLVNEGNWTRTWHGIQEVTMQVAKLVYYKVWILPRAVASFSMFLPASS
jgi:hypothetical protein